MDPVTRAKAAAAGDHNASAQTQADEHDPAAQTQGDPHMDPAAPAKPDAVRTKAAGAGHGDVTAVRRFDPRTDAAAWANVYGAGRRADSGSAGASTDDGATRWVTAGVDGVAELSASGYLRLYVDPPARRRGLGRALLTAVARESGHVTLRGTVVVGGPGEAFARRAGAHSVVELIVAAQHLADVDDLPPAHIPIVHWRGQAPPPWRDSYAQAKQSIMDAPDARLLVATQPPDPDRWVSAAVDGPVVIGFTEVHVPPAGGTASQEDTVVLPDRRGAGIGRAVKLDLVRRLREDRPDVTRITSTVSAANTPMLALNRALGYVEIHRRRLVEVRREDVLLSGC